MKPKITVIFKHESLKNQTVKRLKHGTYEWEKALLSPPPPTPTPTGNSYICKTL